MQRVKLPDEEATFEMAPMIDMVFLLLIFFMCASTFPDLLSDKTVNLPIAANSLVPKNKKQPLIINIHDDGGFYWGKDKKELSDIMVTVTETLSQFPEEHVYIRADKATPHRFVREAIAACSKAGVADIVFGAYQTD